MSRWTECSKYVLPRKDNTYGGVTPGQDKQRWVFDGTPIQANEILASSLAGMMISSTDKWLEWSSGFDEVDQVPAVSAWLQEVSDIQLAVLSNTNFYTEAHETFLDLGAIGTSVFYVEEDAQDDVIFLSSPIYDFYIEADIFKRVVTVCSEKRYKYHQLVLAFGADKIPEEVTKKALADSGGSDSYTVIQFVELNGLYDTKDDSSRPWTNIHFLLEDGAILRNEGNWEMPYQIARWSVSQDEIYGRSPAMKAMPDIRMLNQVMRFYLRGVQKTSDPILQVPADGFLRPLDTSPGGINYYRPGRADRIEPVNLGSRPEVSNDLLNDARTRILKAFFVDQLQLRDGPQMTATETMQRTEEQMRVIGPQTSRLHNDWLKTSMVRVFNILQRAGKFPKPPKELEGVGLNVKLVSRMAKAQRMGLADSLIRTLTSLGPVVELAPERTLGSIRPDMALRIYGKFFGLPIEILKTPEEVAQEERQQQQQMQAAQQAEIDKQSAGAEKDMAQAAKTGSEVQGGG